MNVLWITNILFPEADQLLTGSGELRATGGWMLGAANALLTNDDIHLSVASVSAKVLDLTILKGEKIDYYVLPLGKGNEKYNSDYEQYWKEVNARVQPDIVHIHGTEYAHGYAYMKACGINNVVISIQGLTSVYCDYYYAGMRKRDILRNITLKDMLRGSIIQEKRRFKERGHYERDMIKMAKHIIGRTSWDMIHVWSINPDTSYHFCNETLRDVFYGGSIWKYEHCIKHSIFISQAGYPIKGLHQVLKAMPLILTHYPDTTIRIAGGDITKSESLYDKMRISGYGKYIRALIKRYGLQDKVIFTGNLNGEHMKREYLSANVFICPSSIENSPNSLGEAQILGTPVIASYVGGIPDMMIGNECNLYRFEEVEMLAKKVCDVFQTADLQKDMSQISAERHDVQKNCTTLLNIYKKIANY